MPLDILGEVGLLRPSSLSASTVLTPLRLQVCSHLEPNELFNFATSSKLFRSLLLSRAGRSIWKTARFAENFILPSGIDEVRFASLLHCYMCFVRELVSLTNYSKLALPLHFRAAPTTNCTPAPTTPFFLAAAAPTGRSSARDDSARLPRGRAHSSCLNSYIARSKVHAAYPDLHPLTTSIVRFTHRKRKIRSLASCRTIADRLL